MMKLTLLGTGCPSIDYKRCGASNLVSTKKTKILNEIAKEANIDFGSAKVYYFKELNCLPADTEFEFQRLMSNLSHVSILVMQQLTTDIRGIRVEELKK